MNEQIYALLCRSVFEITTQSLFHLLWWCHYAARRWWWWLLLLLCWLIQLWGTTLTHAEKPKPYHKISGLYPWQIMTKQRMAAEPDRNMLLNNAPCPRRLRRDNPWHQAAAGSLTECSLHGLKVIAVTRAELCSASLLLNATEQAEQRGRVTVTVNNIPLLIDNNQPRLHE